MRLRTSFVTLSTTLALLGFGSFTAANAATIDIDYHYSSYSSPGDPNHPDFYIRTFTFNLPSNFTNASLDITTLHMDDRGVVELNGDIVTSSGISNNLGLDGQMIFTDGGNPIDYTFKHDYYESVFESITTGFKAGLNTIELIVNDTSGGLNFREGLLSGGYFWYTFYCYYCDYSEVRNGVTYYRGSINPATGVDFVGKITYDVEGTSAVPVPPALPLLASGVGALGFAGWRRRRNNHA